MSNNIPLQQSPSNGDGIVASTMRGPVEY